MRLAIRRFQFPTGTLTDGTMTKLALGLDRFLVSLKATCPLGSLHEGKGMNLGVPAHNGIRTRVRVSNTGPLDWDRRHVCPATLYRPKYPVEPS